MCMEQKKSRGWYEIAYVAALVLLVLSFFLTNRHRVGVVDFNRIIREVGLDSRIADDTRTQQQAAALKIQEIQAKANATLKGLNQQLETASAEKKQELQTQLVALQREFQEERNAIVSDVTRHNEKVTATFQLRVAPIVARIAAKKSLDMVLDSRAGIVWHAPGGSFDITEQVIEAAQSTFTTNAPLIDETLLSQFLPPGKGADAPPAAATPASGTGK